MVFIQSQGYTDSYGKRSKNIIDLSSQSDYKMSLNPDTGAYDVSIVMGDYEKYLYSAPNEPQCTKIFQNMLKYHGANENTTMVDVEAFMIPEVESDSSLEEIEELMSNVLEFFGYEGLVNAWNTKLTELNEEYEGVEDSECGGECIESPMPSPLERDDTLTSNMMIHSPHDHHTRYRHYM